MVAPKSQVGSEGTWKLSLMEEGKDHAQLCQRSKIFFIELRAQKIKETLRRRDLVDRLLNGRVDVQERGTNQVLHTLGQTVRVVPIQPGTILGVVQAWFDSKSIHRAKGSRLP